MAYPKFKDGEQVFLLPNIPLSRRTEKVTAYQPSLVLDCHAKRREFNGAYYSYYFVIPPGEQVTILSHDDFGYIVKVNRLSETLCHRICIRCKSNELAKLDEHKHMVAV